ncbi:asparagine synthase (glutamine-hydrolyzing) [Saccharopolyspora pogona]|uniref:asparagine synthase (glutamine-hydrolyzing) n=1 Tax=Saccharopolyspora pogona TaxID=333966 RepID=UPI001687F507|nr:asparagine synthase (glutamine-hydrolyzing) [Saccharopolyspora pogona]
MCGITGWVSFDQDLTNHASTLRAMTATMALRGPDAEGMWLRPRVGLGHRRLSVIDLDGGAQPMTSRETTEDGTPLVALSYSGEVYNYQELRVELTKRGHSFHTRSDTEVVLRSYLEWGADAITRFNGMFAFALWDSRSEELLLVRDRLGVKPLFFHRLGDGVLFGSEPKAILAHPDVRAVVTLDGLRDVLSYLRIPGRTPLRDVFEVRPGHFVRVRHSELTEHRYWKLESTEHGEDAETSVAYVRDLLEDIVRRQMIADVPLCTLLSGGLDSSALTALAQRGQDERVRSYSVDFVGQEENFVAEEFREAPDAPFARELVKHVGTEHREIVLGNAQLVAPGVRDAVLRAWDLPYGFGDLDPSLYLLFKAVRAESTVALSGETADEVFGGYLWFHDPRATSADTFPWHAVTERPVVVQSTAFLDRDLVTALDLETYIADEYRTALAAVPTLPGETGSDARMRAASYLNITHFLPLMLDRKDRMSMAVGLEVRVPFCDHRLVEYVFNAPWSLKTYDGREKSLLRGATADLLPTSIVTRRKAPYPSTQDLGYDRWIKRALAEIAAEPSTPGLLDAQAIRDFVAAPTDRVSTMLERMWFTEVPLRLNNWTAAYEVKPAW